MKKLYLSKSMINSYLYCPMQCKLQFIDRIKVEPSEALVRGIAIHKALETYYDNLDVNDLKRDPKMAIYDAMFESEDAQKYKDYMNGIYEWEVRRAFHCMKNNKDFETYFIPKYRELKIRSEDLMWVGVIDNVSQLFDDKVILIDYKSGSLTRKIPKELPNYLKEEMMFYKILFESEYDDDIEMLGIMYTHKQNGFKNIKPTEKLRSNVITISNIVRNGIKIGIFPHTEDLYKCATCDYKNECIKRTTK